MPRSVLAFESDEHGNCKLGLLNPNTILHDLDEQGNYREWRPKLSATQTYLWGLRQLNLTKTLEWAEDDALFVFLTGDITHGKQYAAHLVSERDGDQYIIARDNLDEWAKHDPAAMRLCIGTGAHNFGQGSAEMVVAEMLRDRHPKLDLKVLYHGSVDVQGVKVDYAHHGPSPGIRDWTKGNVARLYLRSLVKEDIGEGKQPPDLVVRGHYHQYKREFVEERYNGRWHLAQLVILPCYCGMDDFGHKATQSQAYQSHGMVAFEIVDGNLGEMRRWVQRLDLRTKETL